MFEGIATTILTKAVEGASGIVLEAVKRKNSEQLKQWERLRTRDRSAAKPSPIVANLSLAKPMLQDALVRHVNDIKKWCEHIRFSDLKGAKLVTQVYVQLDTYLMPVNLHVSEVEKSQKKPLLSVIRDSPGHLAILGVAGAGKTTSMQKVCCEFFEHGKWQGACNFPVLVILREISATEKPNPLLSKLKESLALNASFSVPETAFDPDFIRDVEARMVARYLDELNVAILLDGFDELPTEDLRERVVSDINFLVSQLKSSRLIVTSRSSDFKYRLSSIDQLEIAPLSVVQIEAFAQNWLGSEVLARDFLKKVQASPFADTTIRPLTIAHLCAIYERIKDIPEKPKSVYRRVVQLLLEDWDSQRSIKRPSAYANFEQDRKFEFLSHLAFHLTVKLQQLTFSSESLKDCYKSIHSDHGLPATQALRVVAELESHSGLILESGHGSFEFAHKSLQEYLAADYINRLPNLIPLDGKLSLLPNELAIATSLSSRPSDFLAELFLKAVDVERESTGWLSTFLTRLAMEKPDLHVGGSIYGAIAVMYLIGRLDAADPAHDLLKAALPRGTRALLKRYYQIVEESRSYVGFRRHHPSQSYRIPDQLRVPTNMLPLDVAGTDSDDDWGDR